MALVLEVASLTDFVVADFAQADFAVADTAQADFAVADSAVADSAQAVADVGFVIADADLEGFGQN